LPTITGGNVTIVSPDNDLALVSDLEPRPPVRSIAVVGCGYWGVNHIRVLSQIDGLDVVPVDVQTAQAKELANRFRLDRYAESLEAISHDVDAVVVATPPSSHHQIALGALEAGCHVFVEKPLANSVAECDDLIRAAELADRTLAVGHTFLFSPGVTSLKSTINDPGFGAPVHITSERLNLGLYRGDVDVLWDLAPHDISIINHVLDSRPTSVSCWAAARRSHNNDIAAIVLNYSEPDVTATVHVSWLHPEKIRRITAVGENRMAELDDTRPKPLQVYDVAVRVDEDCDEVSYHYGDITIPVVPGGEPLQQEIRDFLACCSTGDKPRSEGRDGREVVQVLEAADLSLKSGRPVDIAEMFPASSDEMSRMIMLNGTLDVDLTSHVPPGAN